MVMRLNFIFLCWTFHYLIGDSSMFNGPPRIYMLLVREAESSFWQGVWIFATS